MKKTHQNLVPFELSPETKATKTPGGKRFFITRPMSEDIQLMVVLDSMRSRRAIKQQHVRHRSDPSKVVYKGIDTYYVGRPTTRFESHRAYFTAYTRVHFPLTRSKRKLAASALVCYCRKRCVHLTMATAMQLVRIFETVNAGNNYVVTDAVRYSAGAIVIKRGRETIVGAHGENLHVAGMYSGSPHKTARDAVMLPSIWNTMNLIYSDASFENNLDARIEHEMNKRKRL